MGCIQWLSRFSILLRQSRKIFRHAAAADTVPDKSDEGAVESRMQESIFRIRSVYPRYISRARIFLCCLKSFYNKENFFPMSNIFDWRFCIVNLISENLRYLLLKYIS